MCSTQPNDEGTLLIPTADNDVVAALTVEAVSCTIAEQGWQSWGPSTTYNLTDRPLRPLTRNSHQLCDRSGRLVAAGFRSDGVMAIQHETGGAVTLVTSVDPTMVVPTITAAVADVSGNQATIEVRADGPCSVTVDEGPDGIDGALARWADRVAAALGVDDVRPAPTIWCSWYHYFDHVTEDDIDENVTAARDLELPIDVIQVDDGYQAEIGDWLSSSGRFKSVPGMFDRIHQAGFRSGVWTNPFMVGAQSDAFRDHPERLVTDADGRPIVVAHHWDQDLYVLDTTHPSAQDWIAEVFGWFHDIGLSFHKIDFINAAAIQGVRHDGDIDGIGAYRLGVQLVRQAIGPEAYLLGCGAPILPSIGLVDGMRVSPDTAPHYEAFLGDMAQPSMWAAMVTGRARAFQQGRWWANDPDCLLVRPAVSRRQDWAAHVAAWGGLRGSSDRLRDLDDWGLATTRELLSDVPVGTFIPS